MAVIDVVPDRALTFGDQALFQGVVKQLSDGAVVNVTNYTVTFRYWFNNGPKSTAAATLSDAANGEVQYRFGSPGLPGHGTMRYEWLVDDGTNPVMSTDTYEVRVRRRR
jgi:hypothetical protein